MKSRAFLLLLFLFALLVPIRSAQAADCTRAEYFNDTVWKSRELVEGFTRYHILKSDGSSGYSTTPGDFIFDGTDTWKVEGGFLVLIWTNGFSTERYPLGGKKCTILNGRKTSEHWKGTRPVRLTKVGGE
jgi:hypothetical protein